MWYVVQTESANEHLTMEILKNIAEPGSIKKLFVPVFEDVMKRGGKSHIVMRRLFPGYFFIDTNDPESVFGVLKKIPEFTRFVGAEEKDDEKIFLSVDKDDEDFLNSLMENGVMRVSYVKRDKNGKIIKIVGPLSKYRNQVKKYDISRRRAIVQANIFGKVRKIKFGLWTDDDGELFWLKDLINKETNEEKTIIKGKADIGIYPGDKVVDETGIYEGSIFTVSSVNPYKRTLQTTIELFGNMIDIQMKADNVRKIS